MIDLKHYEKILENGLMMDHYLVLCMVRDGESLPINRRVQGFLNLLNKKGYIQDSILTEEGALLCEGGISGDKKEEVNQNDFTNWVVALHKRCQMKLMELTGGKQVRDKIKGKPYPFLPNSTDMAKVLHRAIVIYKLKDTDKIERAMMGHIEKCYRARNWFPLMKYYIIKGGTSDAASDMVTDMDSLDEKDNEGGKSLQKFV